jgi:hypothetical protein
MSTRIDQVDGVVGDVAVPIERLRIHNTWDNRICRDEPAQLRQVVPRAVIHQPAGGVVQPLAGVAEIGQIRLLANPHLAEGRVHHLATLDAQAVRIAEHRGAAQGGAVAEVQPALSPPAVQYALRHYNRVEALPLLEATFVFFLSGLLAHTNNYQPLCRATSRLEIVCTCNNQHIWR